MKEVIISDYKKLFLYKSWIYKKTIFKTDSDDKELQKIAEALNIKNRKARIEYIYDAACEQIDEFYKGKNLCKFANGQCILQQGCKENYKNGCCRLCEYQSSNGCTTSNLTCKLYYCDTAQKDIETMKIKEIPTLKLLTFRQRMMLQYEYFSSRELILLDLRVNLLIFFAIRTLIHTTIMGIKLLVKKNKKESNE